MADEEDNRKRTAPADVAIEHEGGESEEDESNEKFLPWGKRPSFRAMLAGGNKKLTLLNPPKGVIKYFADPVVFRPFGCTYDNTTGTFYATTPGAKGRANGQIVALAGNCQDKPVIVTRDLLEPAAITVYEPGLSVCVVTNCGIFVFTRKLDEDGDTTDHYSSRQISLDNYHRGIAATAGGGIISFSNRRIRMFDGSVADRKERVITETDYDKAINGEFFRNNESRRSARSNCCFMDIVENRLVMSDLQKHVISLWRIEESTDENGEKTGSIVFDRAIDVAIDPHLRGRGTRPSRIPYGKCAFASGIRLDAEGWVLCADAEGRTIQIFDNDLKFVTRVSAPPDGLPYMSGLYIEAGGHLMVCNRKSQNAGLSVYMLEAVDKKEGEEEEEEKEKEQEKEEEASGSGSDRRNSKRPPYPHTYCYSAPVQIQYSTSREISDSYDHYNRSSAPVRPQQRYRSASEVQYSQYLSIPTQPHTSNLSYPDPNNYSYPSIPTHTPSGVSYPDPNSYSYPTMPTQPHTYSGVSYPDSYGYAPPANLPSTSNGIPYHDTYIYAPMNTLPRTSDIPYPPDSPPAMKRSRTQ